MLAIIFLSFPYFPHLIIRFGVPMRFTVLSLALLAGASTCATAEVINPLVPEWRGSANTEFFGWESFTQTFAAPNFPDSPFSMDAQLFNFASGAMISSGGNLYGPNGLNIHIYGFGVPAEIVLNFTTIGSIVDSDAFQAFLGDESQQGEYFAPTSSALQYSENLGEMGYIQTWAVTYDFSSFQGDADNWALFFGTESPHFSLDAVTVDVRSVPAPGALALLGLAGVARRRRR